MDVDHLGAHLRIEKGIRVQDGENNVNHSSSALNMVEAGK